MTSISTKIYIQKTVSSDSTTIRAMTDYKPITINVTPISADPININRAAESINRGIRAMHGALK